MIGHALRYGLAILVLLMVSGAARAEDDGCTTCHLDPESFDEPLVGIAKRYAKDVHRRAKISCVFCHGGNAVTDQFMLAHRRADGFRKSIPPDEVVELCARCHDDAGRMSSLGGKATDVRPGRDFLASVHGRIPPVEGYERPTCVSCHGAHGVSGPDDPASRVHPTRVPETCARCHGDLGYMQAFTSARVPTDQLTAYRTSRHSKRLETGDVKVAVCSSCHGSHRILPATDPGSTVHPLRVAGTCGRCHSDPEYMAGYEIRGPDGTKRALPTDQGEHYGTSVHHRALTEAGDLSAPTCNDCHGNHGATPPEVRTVANVCAQCHSRPAELFLPSEMRKEMDRLGLPLCATCHGNHAIRHPDDEFLAGVAQGLTDFGWSVGDAWREKAAGFLAGIRHLEARIEEVEENVARAEQYGHDLTRARLRLSEARDSLVKSRVVIHTWDAEQVETVLRGTGDEPGGLASLDLAQALAEEAFADRKSRRVGLAFSLLLIVSMMVGLILKIRRMESRAVCPVHEAPAPDHGEADG